jgi:putative oxidoreductase
VIAELVPYVETASFDATSFAIAMLRVATGVTVALHGYNKFFGGGKLPGTARWFESLGMRGKGQIHAITAATTEVAGGLAFAAGLLTPLAGAGIVGLMVVATWTHKDHFFIFKDGWEYNFILAVIAISVSTMGPGRYSLDWALGIERVFDPNIGLLVSAGLGIVTSTALLLIAWRPPTPASDESGD